MTKFNNYGYELSTYDIKARDLLNSVELKGEERTVAWVFLHQPMSAQTYEDIQNFVKALGRHPDHDYHTELDSLVKAKVLRKRKNRGVTLWELNFSEEV